eukprot:4852196-Prymnesium_polylepis.1
MACCAGLRVGRRPGARRGRSARRGRVGSASIVRRCVCGARPRWAPARVRSRPLNVLEHVHPLFLLPCYFTSKRRDRAQL